MRPSTIDLLRIRDGEPVDADVRRAVDSDPALRADLEALRRTQQALSDLPALAPPAGVWDRIAARAAAEAKPPRRNRWHWPLRGAIAASVAVFALWFVGRSPAPSGLDVSAPATIVADQNAGPSVAPVFGTPTYAALIEESARLERELDGITYRPQVVRVSTATIIAGLEDQIGLIDERLMFARSLGLSPAQTRALWQQRVELMNALVEVRYADLQRFAF
jgi:hypothetical protein